MTKEQTTQIKGIAILMMLWHHLFTDSTLVAQLYCLLPPVEGIPFATWIDSAMSPVAILLFLSGFFIFVVTIRTGGDTNRFGCMFHLFFIFWCTLLVFVPIGHLVKPLEYPKSFITFLGNITGIDPSYNTAMWFLAPYVLLALSAKPIIQSIEGKNIWIVLGIWFPIAICVSWWISHHVDFLNHYRIFYIALEYIALSFSFLLGIYSERTGILSKIAAWSSTHRFAKYVAPIMLIALIVLKCMIHTSIIGCAYVFAFIVITLCLKLPNVINRCLKLLGTYSMTMWMIHSYFYAYLFHDFFYSFKTPLLIFLVLVVFSLFTSVIIQTLGNRGYRIISSIIALWQAKSNSISDAYTNNPTNKTGGGGGNNLLSINYLTTIYQKFHTLTLIQTQHQLINWRYMNIVY